MFHNKFAGLCKTIIFVLFFTIVLTPVSWAEQQIKLIGRVLTGTIYWPTEGSSRSQEFIFGVESKDRRGNEKIELVLIHYYSCWNDKNSLEKDFFDYSKIYELSVTKEGRKLSFKKDVATDILFVGSDGKPGTFAGLESVPRVSILDGVPENILNMNMDIMLPKYSLLINTYKIIKEESRK